MPERGAAGLLSAILARVTIHDVVVVGAGFAGVTAARELAAEGRSVLIVEARDRIGGRTWYKRSALGGWDLELGGNFIDPSQQLVCREVSRYGIEVTSPERLSLPAAWLVGGRLIEGGSPIPLEELGDLERLLQALFSAAQGIDPDEYLTEQDLGELDISFDRLLDRLQLGPTVRELASVVMSTAAGMDAADTSALHWLRLSAAAGGVLRLLGVDNQSFREGTVSLLEAMLAEANVELRLSCPVRRIEQSTGRVTVVTDAERFEACAAVVTIPPGVLNQIDFEPVLGDAKLRAVRESHAGTGVKVWATVQGAPADWSALGRGPGLDIAWTLRSEEGNSLVVGFGPDARALDPNDLAAVRRAIGAYLPNAEVTACTGHDWTTDRYALGTWPSFRPGQITRDERALSAPHGRIAFAGSETARRWPTYIEGAIESGFRAARDTASLLAV
jgi:monoamine oxidase